MTPRIPLPLLLSLLSLASGVDAARADIAGGSCATSFDCSSAALPVCSNGACVAGSAACTGDDAHAIIMPNVTEQLAARFTSDYLAWWDGR